MQYFQLKCEMEGGTPHTYGISKSQSVRTPEAAVQFATEVVGIVEDRPVTRLHWKDPTTGEYTSIAKVLSCEIKEMTPIIQSQVAALIPAPKAAS